MNDNELNNALRELASRPINAPDLSNDVRRAIAQGKRGGASAGTYRGLVPVLALSAAASVAIGVGLTLTTSPAASTETRRTEAAGALHLNVFHTTEAVPFAALSASTRNPLP